MIYERGNHSKKSKIVSVESKIVSMESKIVLMESGRVSK
jgi:hypothetical protein